MDLIYCFSHLHNKCITIYATVVKYTQVLSIEKKNDSVINCCNIRFITTVMLFKGSKQFC